MLKTLLAVVMLFLISANIFAESRAIAMDEDFLLDSGIGLHDGHLEKSEKETARTEPSIASTYLVIPYFRSTACITADWRDAFVPKCASLDGLIRPPKSLS
jgi:hypothetical protein